MRAALIVATGFFAVAASAQENELQPVGFTCTQGELVRTVRVQYPQGGANVCEVMYGKPTEGWDDGQDGDERVRWSAEHSKDYCEPKAMAFIEKLTSRLGWTCERDASA